MNAVLHMQSITGPLTNIMQAIICTTVLVNVCHQCGEQVEYLTPNRIIPHTSSKSFISMSIE